MFWTCLLLFLLGHAAAVAWFRSGRPWVGVVVVAWLWITADAAMIARFLFHPALAEWRLLAWAMALGAALASAHVAVLLVRRRTARAIERRLTCYREGLVAYLASDLTLAARRFRTLVRKDPWDRDSWAALEQVTEAMPVLPRKKPAPRRATPPVAGARRSS